jgi:hypothetical protein
MILDHADEWGHFLHARKLIIDRFVQEQKSFPEIAIILSMDPMQVQLIAMTDVDPTRLAVPPGRSVTQETERPQGLDHLQRCPRCRSADIMLWGVGSAWRCVACEDRFTRPFVYSDLYGPSSEPAVPPPALPTCGVCGHTQEDHNGGSNGDRCDRCVGTAISPHHQFAAAPPALLALQQENEQLRARIDGLDERLGGLMTQVDERSREACDWRMKAKLHETAASGFSAKLNEQHAALLALVTRWDELAERCLDSNPELAAAYISRAAELRAKLERDT